MGVHDYPHLVPILCLCLIPPLSLFIHGLNNLLKIPFGIGFVGSFFYTNDMSILSNKPVENRWTTIEHGLPIAAIAWSSPIEISLIITDVQFMWVAEIMTPEETSQTQYRTRKLLQYWSLESSYTYNICLKNLQI